MPAGSPAPLKGTKVVDMTHAWAGPTCSMILGDLGAEVVKVEPPTGDSFRVAADGALFVNINRNKRGLSLDLKKEQAREILRKMLARADVFVENYLPGAMERLGLGYEAVRQGNPGIIYCSISGYGQAGPFRERPGYDPVAQAMSGIMMATGHPDGPPARILPATIDYCSGVNAALGILASLMERQKTGEGRRIDVALLDVAINQMSPYVTRYKLTGELPERMGSGHTAWAPYEAFPTRDGEVLIAVTTDQMWQNLCKALDWTEMVCQPECANLAGRKQHRKEIVTKLRKITAQYGSLELEAKLVASDVPCAKVRTIGEAIDEPHVKARGVLEETDYPGMGSITTVKTPIFFSGEAPPTRRQAPLLGEHTREILAELGYSPSQVENLLSGRVVFQCGK